MKIHPLILFVLMFCGCSDYEEFEGVKIRQYATKVIRYSSQYSNTSWAATRALGKENVYPNYGDYSNAWASLSDDEQREYLELGFDTLQTVKTIQIYETWNPGAVDSVFLRDASSKKWNLVYAKPAVKNLPEKSRIFTFYLIETHYFTDAIRIAINSPVIPGWNEIDAVVITGQRN
ncbi:MAG: hypothetical protein ABL895_07435 [Cyclobacteriaceae bacterium]